MFFFRNIAQFLMGKSIIVILAILFIVHLGIMSFYFKDNLWAHREAHRDEVIQKMINTIYLVEATPLDNRQHAVSVLSDPVLHASLTQIPKWPLQFTDISFIKISHALRNNFSSFAVSIQLYKNQWLNLSADVYYHFLLRQLIVMCLEFIMFVTIIICAWSVTAFIRPLRKFKRAAERLGIDLQGHRLDINGPFVVREAAEAMNRMQQRITDLIRDRTQMLAAISHDLKTPITRMKIRCQLLEEDVIAQNLNQDLEEMEHMIGETLAFASDDAANETRVKIDLVSLLDTICDDAQDMGHEVVFRCYHKRVTCLAKPIALKRAFTNLINNGIRYGPPVEVSLFQYEQSVWVNIVDHGPGIAESEMGRVFEPFYRSEYSRSRDTGGAGLGLAVTKDIIAAHQGYIVLSNRRVGGLRARIILTLE